MSAKESDGRDFVEVVMQLTAAAEEYVNRSPKVKRLEAERSALLDAISGAQLQLSVRRLPKEPAREAAAKAVHPARTRAIEEKWKRSEAALKELERRLRPLTAELDEAGRRVQEVKATLEEVLEKPSQERAA